MSKARRQGFETAELSVLGSAPANPATGFALFYAQTVGGNVQLLLRDASGNVMAAGGRQKIAEYTVSGAAKQHLVFGSGGDAVMAFMLGRRYEMEAYIKPGTVGSVNTYSFDPNSQTSNLTFQYLFASNTSVSAARQTDGVLYGDSGNELVYVKAEWSELTGFDRVVEMMHQGFDDTGPIVDSINRFGGRWKQTPAQAALTTVRLGGSLADSMGIGTRMAIFDVGAA